MLLLADAADAKMLTCRYRCLLRQDFLPLRHCHASPLMPSYLLMLQRARATLLSPLDFSRHTPLRAATPPLAAAAVFCCYAAAIFYA